MIRQGDVYWLHFGSAQDSPLAGRRPAWREVLRGLVLLFGTDEAAEAALG